MFVKNQSQNQKLNYQRFYPSSKRGHPCLKKLLIFIVLTIILTIIIVLFIKHKKNANLEKSLNEKITEKKNSNEKLQNEINTLNSEISELNKKSEELKTNLEKLQKEQQANKDKVNSELSEINNKLSSLEKEFNNMEEQTKKLDEDIDKINKDNNDAEDKIKQLKVKLESLEKEKDSKIKKTSTLADTVILTDDNIKSILNSFDAKLNLNLLYRASKHGKDVSDLKKNVGSHKNLLIVGKTSDNLILGGYTTINLDGKGFKEDKYAFLYNFNKEKKFKIKKEKEALYLKDGEFPGFGDGDIVFGPGKIKSKFPKSYKGDDLELTNGKSEINFDDIEVFYLTKQK
jgi:predicted  nucleic acid-binding Zn-ribbon protein